MSSLSNWPNNPPFVDLTTSRAPWPVDISPATAAPAVTSSPPASLAGRVTSRAAGLLHRVRLAHARFMVRGYVGARRAHVLRDLDHATPEQIDDWLIRACALGRHYRYWVWVVRDLEAGR